MKLKKAMKLKKSTIRIKEAFASNKSLILNTIIHAMLAWGALAFSYNTYKEIVRRTTPAFPHELKAAIKSTFPWGVMVFAALYLLYTFGRHREERRPGVKQYAVILLLYALILSIVSVQKGGGVLIVANVSVPYLIMLLFAWGWLRRLIVIDMDKARWLEEILPPVIYKALQGKTPELGGYFRKRPSVAFVGGFTVFLVLCAVLVSLNQAKAAEKLAGIVYLLLMIGVGIEVYQFIRGGEDYGKK
ncbi:MAG: hypothetical protein ACE5EB_04245 [Thermodesulfobacteriota bacterium]